MLSFSRSLQCKTRRQTRSHAHAHTCCIHFVFFPPSYTTDTDQAFLSVVLVGFAAFDWIRPHLYPIFFTPSLSYSSRKRKSFLFFSLPTYPAGYVHRPSFVHLSIH